MDVRCALTREEIIETGRRNAVAASARAAARCLESVGVVVAARFPFVHCACREEPDERPSSPRDAVLVPANFVVNMTASSISSRRNNRVWADNGPNGSAFNQASSLERYTGT